MLLINNELIWIAIPRCASVSIENSLYNSSLNIKKIISERHLIEEFNNKIKYRSAILYHSSQFVAILRYIQIA